MQCNDVSGLEQWEFSSILVFFLFLEEPLFAKTNNLSKGGDLILLFFIIELKPKSFSPDLYGFFVRKRL